MAKLIDLNGLAHVYSIIKGMLADKLGKNDTAVNASKVNNLTVETAVPKNAKFTDTVYTHPSTHPASMITGLASVATSGSYSDLSNKPTIPVVPTKVSAFINDAGYLTQHQSLDDYASKADVSALLSTKLGVTATAYAATRDGAGNVITDTYAKKTDVSGGGGVSTSESNTWTAEQIFNDVTISGLEKSEPVILHGNSITPTSSHTIWQAEVNSTSSLCTLNLDGLLAKTNNISRFEILFSGGSSTVAPTLKITSTNNNIPIFIQQISDVAYCLV